MHEASVIPSTETAMSPLPPSHLRVTTQRFLEFSEAVLKQWKLSQMVVHICAAHPLYFPHHAFLPHGPQRQQKQLPTFFRSYLWYRRCEWRHLCPQQAPNRSYRGYLLEWAGACAGPFSVLQRSPGDSFRTRSKVFHSLDSEFYCHSFLFLHLVVRLGGQV